jgi:hypothetical protein
MKRALAVLLFAAACTHAPEASSPERAIRPSVYPHDVWFANLSALCGLSFEGKVVSTDAIDEDWRRQRIVATIGPCTDNEVRVPLALGEDRSRTWIITYSKDGTRLAHDHRHADGTPDVLTLYGGASGGISHERQQQFPADDYSKALFEREGRAVSKDNVWTIEVWPEYKRLTYRLTRPNRNFQLDFDTAKPLPE